MRSLQASRRGLLRPSRHPNTGCCRLPVRAHPLAVSSSELASTSEKSPIHSLTMERVSLGLVVGYPGNVGPGPGIDIETRKNRIFPNMLHPVESISTKGPAEPQIRPRHAPRQAGVGWLRIIRLAGLRSFLFPCFSAREREQRKGPWTSPRVRLSLTERRMKFSGTRCSSTGNSGPWGTRPGGREVQKLQLPA